MIEQLAENHCCGCHIFAAINLIFRFICSKWDILKRSPVNSGTTESNPNGHVGDDLVKPPFSGATQCINGYSFSQIITVRSPLELSEARNIPVVFIFMEIFPWLSTAINPASPGLRRSFRTKSIASSNDTSLNSM